MLILVLHNGGQMGGASWWRVCYQRGNPSSLTVCGLLLARAQTDTNLSTEVAKSPTDRFSFTVN